MVIYQYRWKIPPGEQENFRRDWAELTAAARAQYGATDVGLYVSQTGEYVAIAKWPSSDAWNKWVKGLANHPMREKYRQWRVAGPELLSPLIVFEGAVEENT